jgi:hypothetical protein
MVSRRFNTGYSSPQVTRAIAESGMDGGMAGEVSMSSRARRAEGAARAANIGQLFVSRNLDRSAMFVTVCAKNRQLGRREAGDHAPASRGTDPLLVCMARLRTGRARIY